MAWELQNFGICIAEWIAEDPPIAWRLPVNRWVRSLLSDPFDSLENEPSLDTDEWSGWSCEVPGTGDALVAVVAFVWIHHELPVVRCVKITNLPRYHE